MRGWLACAAVAVMLSRAQASTIEELSPERLFAEADRVVDGTVAQVTTRWNAAGTGLETVAVVAVAATWRGAPATEVTVVAHGGSLGTTRHIVFGMPSLRVGERARWFLRDRGDGQLAVYGWAQGKWPAHRIAGFDVFAPAPLYAEDPDRLLKYTTNGMVWPAALMPVPYRVHVQGSDDLPRNDVIAAIDAAFATWQAVPCAALAFTNAGPTTLDLAVDGTNILRFVETGWIYGTEAAAATSLFIIAGQQTADIAMNGERFTWATGPDNSLVNTTLDLQAVLTHEIGHFSGLGHTMSAFDTMYYSWKPWQGQRTLSVDDKLGLCSIYPTPGDECDPATCPTGESCVQHAAGRLCTGAPDPIGTPCNYDRVECTDFCLFTAADLSSGYCSRFCDSDLDCPLTHHCEGASAGTMTVKACFIGAQPPRPPPPVDPAACATDADCAAGQHCDVVAGACTFECRTDADCGGDRSCDGRGVCSGDVVHAGGGCSASHGDGALLVILLALAGLRLRRRAAVGGLLVALASCADEGLVPCGNGQACPLGFACDLAHAGCVLPDQLDACAGQADGTRCTYADVVRATCVDQVCFAAECGNLVLDEGEACDDGNRANGDGCTSDCLEIEQCGNGTLEAALGEVCDDGDLRNHDGCNSACQLERPDWVRSGTTTLGFRRYATVVHDGRRGRTIAFSGQDVTLVDDTWEWDGAIWTRRPIVGPSERIYPAAEFDAARGEVVVFGGLIGGSTIGSDTWVYDGARWTRRVPLVAPPGRHGAMLVHDVARRRAVMFGGYSNGALRDTWEWDGTTWIEHTPAQRPEARNLAVGCYDPVGGRVLMLGGNGLDGEEFANTMWAWDGTTWTAVAAATVPVGTAFAMAFDASRARLVLLTRDVNDVKEWTWDGIDWTATAVLPMMDINGSALFYDQAARTLGLFALLALPDRLAMMYRSPSGWELVPDPATPPARGETALAYDAGRDEGVLFGGREPGGALLADLWTWQGSSWVARTPAGLAPSARHGHAMIHDAARSEVLVVGGRTVADRTGETWAWNGSAWRLAGTIPAREHMALAFDPRRGKVVGFGGFGIGLAGFEQNLAETWEWDGTTWTSVTIGGPAGRSRAGMVYDARSGRIVLFGGLGDYETFDDVWEYDGSAWTRREPSMRPPARQGHVMAYNAARATTVVMGGRSSLTTGAQLLGDTWEWDGTTWTAIATFLAPGPRDDHTAAHIASTGHVVLFGGAATSETWSFGYDGALTPEVCSSGHDIDGDERIGCDDPDCWWLCSPLCAPRAACDPAAARCGDGTCSALEACRSCSDDCACAAVCGDLFCDPSEQCVGDC